MCSRSAVCRGKTGGWARNWAHILLIDWSFKAFGIAVDLYMISLHVGALCRDLFLSSSLPFKVILRSVQVHRDDQDVKVLLVLEVCCITVATVKLYDSYTFENDTTRRDESIQCWSWLSSQITSWSDGTI